jgi:hypothetical protein
MEYLPATNVPEGGWMWLGNGQKEEKGSDSLRVLVGDKAKSGRPGGR